MPNRRLRVLFVSSEVAPYAKTGGLADVTGSLPTALKGAGVDVRQVLPCYRSIRDKGFPIHPLPEQVDVPLGAGTLKAWLFETTTDAGIPVYFVDRLDFFDRPHLYGEGSRDYGDNLERFSFFCHAARRLPEVIKWRPHLIHCHDWQTGLLPALHKGARGQGASSDRPKSVFTIHNIGYPGLFPQDRFGVTGLSRDDFFNSRGLEYYGWISLLKSGIVFSDAVTTVSPTYAREIQTPEYGMGMDGILRQRQARLYGILNGADYEVWDPGKDPHIAQTYDPDDMTGKRACKQALIQEMGLDSNRENRPLLAMISRFDSQKGLDLFLAIMDALLQMDVGVVVLGAGDGHVEWSIQEGFRRHPGRGAVYIGFHDALAHRIMAGADMLLVPSRYEPCGLTQIYALKYGTVPVVRGTGGLEDTVQSYAPATGEGNGFKFYPYDAQALFGAVREAVAVYYRSDAWGRLMANGMGADFSWEVSAQRYLDVYASVLDPSAPRVSTP
jgi:starch synthase